MQLPRTLVELQYRFPDEERCWAYLRRARWLRGSTCARCGDRGSHFLTSRRLEQCRTFRYQGSGTAGTVFPRKITSALWNRPGTDKTWVVNEMAQSSKVTREVLQAKRVDER